MEKTEKKEPTGYMVKFVPLTELVVYENNARTHSVDQVNQIVRAVQEFGWTAPILADDQGIVAGHGRLMAAEKIYASGSSIALPGGQELPPGTVPVIDCSGWSEERRRAYIIADNAIPLNSGWDKSLLGLELQELQHLDFDLTLLGLSDLLIDKLIEPPSPAEVKDWDLGEIYEPFWLVVRGPLSQLNRVRTAIEQSQATQLTIEGGQ